MRKFVLLSGLFLPMVSGAQQLRHLDLNTSQTQIISANTSIGLVMPQNALPVFSFEMNKVLYKTTDGAFKNINGKIIRTTILTDPNFHDGVKATISFTNISKKDISISNIVPFGSGNDFTHISGKPYADSSRSFLFQKGRNPVGVIVPHNSNDLNFCVAPLPNKLVLYGLLCRANDSIQNYLLIRTPYNLHPGKTISFYLYADIVKGDWHDALRKCFQEKMLYQVQNFDNTLYHRKDLTYIRDAYTMHLMMTWNKDYYDAADSAYHLPAFLEKMKTLYGGDDVFAIWPTWPVLGLDQRTQWKLMEDLPGGLAQQRKLSSFCHTTGTKYFISYNPWDDTSEKDALENMSKMIAAVDADGVVLDTKAEAGSSLQDAADRAKHGVILYSEGMAVPKDMQGIVSGRVHNDIYYPPLVNLNKLIKPGFAVFRVAEISKERIRREYATAFFNGYGVEINVMRPGHPEWVDDDYRFWGRCVRILKENTNNFHSEDVEILIPGLHDSVYVNKWPGKRKTIYTIFSIIPGGFNAPLFAAEQKKGTHFVDLWNHEPIDLKNSKELAYVPVSLEPFDKKYEGTNNEGAVGAIAQLPDLLTVQLDGDKMTVSTKEGTKIQVWQGNPSYNKVPIEIYSHDSAFHLFDQFGRTEGKYVIRLFDGSDLLDEKIIEISPGAPLLVSETVRTQIVSSIPSGMVKIPAGSFSMQVTSGDEFISYPKSAYPKMTSLKSFYIDIFPVTNLKFKNFLDATHYHPADTTNFLRHWVNGNIAAGEENFPVVNVSYEDAKAYAAWAGKRLPSEAEWQYAAQTSDGRNWPWGNTVQKTGGQSKNISATLTLVDYGEPDSTLCNTGNGTLYPVGTYKKAANPFGVQDLVGCVWQLTNDWYQGDTYQYIILKGGSYYKPGGSWWYVQGGPKPLQYRQMLLRVSQGFERNNTVGFRCVKDAE